MNEGWLWLSILNTTACPSPMSMTPAFSPGPWITQGALVGSVRRWIFEDLYEQCSFHIAEKMPSSVKLGARPMSLTMRAYSSGLRPCWAISSGVMAGSLEITVPFVVRYRISFSRDGRASPGHARLFQHVKTAMPGARFILGPAQGRAHVPGITASV